MKLSDFYQAAVRLAKDRDPRKDKIKIKSYPDSAILYGRPDLEIRKILVGIDIEVAELLLADGIRNREGLDLVVGHHPEGRAFVLLHEVMQLQADLLIQQGLKPLVANKLLKERMQEVSRKILPANHTRPVDAARLLDLPFICLHTPADNHVFWYITQLLQKKRPKKVRDIVGLLEAIPEYNQARTIDVGPRIIIGNPNRQTGKVLVEMTGGTEGSKEVFDKLYKVGVRTLICMHLSEEHFKKVKDANLNVVIAGHISSDSLGLNLLLDRIEKIAGYTFQTINCSGFTRVRRNK